MDASIRFFSRSQHPNHPKNRVWNKYMSNEDTELLKEPEMSIATPTLSVLCLLTQAHSIFCVALCERNQPLS